MSASALLALCFASAAFQVLATAVMKVSIGIPFLLLVLPVCATLGLAAWFESMALPVARIGIVLVTILAFEVIITAAVALALGERYSLREGAGLAAILVGTAILFCPEGGPRKSDRGPVACTVPSPSRLSLAPGILGDRLHHPLQVEAARLLARRELAEALQPVADIGGGRGDQEHPLEHTSAGSPWRPPRSARSNGSVRRLVSAGARSSSNGVLPDAQALGVLPQEGDLPVVVAQRRDVAVVGPVEELAAAATPPRPCSAGIRS